MNLLKSIMSAILLASISSWGAGVVGGTKEAPRATETSGIKVKLEATKNRIFTEDSNGRTRVTSEALSVVSGATGLKRENLSPLLDSPAKEGAKDAIALIHAVKSNTMTERTADSELCQAIINENKIDLNSPDLQTDIGLLLSAIVVNPAKAKPVAESYNSKVRRNPGAKRAEVLKEALLEHMSEEYKTDAQKRGIRPEDYPRDFMEQWRKCKW
jgi:hypothetical protein